jgi:arylsulfatase A-like enzyme
MRRYLLRVIVLVAIGAGLRLPIRPVAPTGLVVITLDTTRADRLPAYGFVGVSTPAIDRLAGEGVVFDNVESVAPLTLPAHASLFTGLYPQHHGVRDNAAPPLDPAHRTLAGILHTRGFRTAAFVGSMVLGRDRGLASGFEVYGDGGRAGSAAPRRRPASDVVDDASAWIKGIDDAPFFLWVHLYDAHASQAVPLEYRRAYGDNYEAAIAYMDTQIARLLDAMREQHLLARSAIVVAGDHGESLGEHGEREHGIFVYEGATHVPLIVHGADVAAKRVKAVTSLVDVLPTVLDLLGITLPGVIDGESLAPALRGVEVADRTVYAESMYAQRFGWAPLRMIRVGTLKYIDAPRPELYDLRTDPLEERDLADARPATVADMRERLVDLAVETPSQPAERAALEPETLRGLAALGYVSPGRAAVGSPPADGGADPKDYIHLFNPLRARAMR